MKPHPQQSSFVKRVAALGDFGRTKFEGRVFRFIKPRYSSADDISNGEGGLKASGRWNLKGCCQISYTSLAPETALAESLAHVRYYRLPEATALPRVLVSLDVSLHRVLEVTDGDVRMRLKLADHTIRNHDWRKVNRGGKEALTQAWGRTFADAGYEGILVKSAAGNAANLVVFPRNLDERSVFRVEKSVEWT